MELGKVWARWWGKWLVREMGQNNLETVMDPELAMALVGMCLVD